MYVVAAQYTVKEGKEQEVIDILKKMIPMSRAEPGCKFYAVNQSPATKLIRPPMRSRTLSSARSYRCSRAASGRSTTWWNPKSPNTDWPTPRLLESSSPSGTRV
jgi:hypothetical protein